MQLKNYDAAEALYRQLIEQHAPAADADAWRLRLGLASYLQKKYGSAIAALSPIVGQLKSADSRGGGAVSRSARASSTRTSSRLHPESLSHSLSENPKWRQADEALLLLARAQAKEGKPAEARATIERLFAEYRHSRVLDEAHYRLAEMLDAREDYPAAAKEYQTVAREFADSPYAPYALSGRGWAEFKSKRFSDGRGIVYCALDRFPRHELAADAQFGRALCLRQAGDAAGAMAAVEAYLQSNPDRSRKSDALYEKGLAQVSLKDFSAAVTTFDDLLKADPSYASADKVLYELGWALKSQDKPAESAAQF